MFSTISSIKTAFKTLSLGDGLDEDACQIIMWLKENQNFSELSSISYRVVVLRFYLYLKINKITLVSVTRRMIIDYLDFLKNPPPEWCGGLYPLEHPLWTPFARKKLSPSSLNYHLKRLHQLFNYLHNIGYIPRNPLTNPIKKYSEVSGEVKERYFTEKECGIIFSFIKNIQPKSYKRLEMKTRALWIFQLLIYTACRRSEVANATMDDFVTRDSQLWLKVIGKGNKYGEIPVISSLEDALNNYRKFYNLPHIRDKKQSEKNIPLIIKTCKNGKYLRSHSSLIRIELRRICIKLSEILPSDNYNLIQKLNNISAHWLRHTSATIQANSGMDIRTVQKNLRHSSIETTMMYQHHDKTSQHAETSDKFRLKF